jgi:hypothetical protein
MPGRALINSSCAVVFVAVFLLLADFAHAALQITPGTVLGFDIINVQLQKYSFDGTLLDTLKVTGLPRIVSGLTVLEDRVFLSDLGGNVGEVNLSTGVVFNQFNGGGNDALGDNGTNLLTYYYPNGVVREFTTSGTLLSTIPLVAGASGMDGAAGRIFLGQYQGNGNILEFSSTGTLTNTIVTGLPPATIFGLGFDPTNDTFWVATGSSGARIQQFSATGALLTNFDAGSRFITGLDIVPAAIPEPNSGFVLIMLTLATSRRRR